MENEKEISLSGDDTVSTTSEAWSTEAVKASEEQTDKLSEGVPEEQLKKEDPKETNGQAPLDPQETKGQQESEENSPSLNPQETQKKNKKTNSNTYASIIGSAPVSLNKNFNPAMFTKHKKIVDKENSDKVDFVRQCCDTIANNLISTDSGIDRIQRANGFCHEKRVKIVQIYSRLIYVKD